MSVASWACHCDQLVPLSVIISTDAPTLHRSSTSNFLFPSPPFFFLHLFRIPRPSALFASPDIWISIGLCSFRQQPDIEIDTDDSLRFCSAAFFFACCRISSFLFLFAFLFRVHLARVLFFFPHPCRVTSLHLCLPHATSGFPLAQWLWHGLISISLPRRQLCFVGARTLQASLCCLSITYLMCLWSFLFARMRYKHPWFSQR